MPTHYMRIGQIVADAVSKGYVQPLDPSNIKRIMIHLGGENPEKDIEIPPGTVVEVEYDTEETELPPIPFG